jgi:acetoacetyl-CoA synthetase
VSDVRLYERPDGEILWSPPPDFIAAARMTDFRKFIEQRERRRFATYDELWQWSVSEIARFWAAIWDYFAVGSPQPAESVLADPSMPGARWFTDARVNFARHALTTSAKGSQLAIRAFSEHRGEQNLTYAQLRSQVAAVAAFLRRSGVRRGDRVAAFLPNVPAAIVGFLAAAAVGAIWSSCPPEMGADSVLERFRQITPKVLFVTRANRYAGRAHDVSDAVARLRAGLPGLRSVVCVDDEVPEGDVPWEEVIREAAPLSFEEVPFDHPLWVLYTSGTTGRPKAIVHGHGGILLEALKNTLLANDRSDKDTVFWFTTTGWVLWNLLVCNLLAGATLVLYDGSPTYPETGALWRIAAQTRSTVFGCSPAYLERCIRDGVTPAGSWDLSALRSVSVSGAPLLGHVARWVYAAVRSDIWLVSGSGGTDVATSFVGASPFMPTRAGHIPARLLGVDVQSYDDTGTPQVDHVGELVIQQPMPSMPLFIWGDEDGSRYQDSYFSAFPGVWRHGDWIEITSAGSAIIYGRSDATLNRRGIRLGSAEIYRVVESFPEVVDSLVVDLPLPDGRSHMPLFVVLRPGAALDAALQARLQAGIAERLSARFVPDEIVAIDEIPRTMTGKKLEVPVKRILLGAQPSEVVAIGTLANPHSLDTFIRLAQRLCGSPTGRSILENDLP